MGSQTQDPREIVQKASEAINKLKAITYEAAYVGHGAMGNYPSYQGTVALERVSTPNGLRARISIEGSGFYPGESTARTYRSTYDGQTVKWLNHKARNLVERELPESNLDQKDWGELIGHFGRPGASTILWEFLIENPFENILKSELLEYQGAISIEGELCHIIYHEEIQSASKRKRMKQWYFSESDFLPRKMESLTNQDGRIGVLALTIAGVRLSNTLSPKTFVVSVPEDYSTAAHQVSEKRVEILRRDTPAPNWSAIDSTGQKIGLSDLKGRVIILDFWAEWCVPCKQAMPVLQRLHEKYSSQGVSVIGVHCFAAKGGKPPMDYIRLKQYTYKQIISGDEIAGAYKVAALPTLFVIDQSGRIAFHHTGYKKELEADLTRIVNQLIK
jgi:thiol-disulfide isomerase/thioredoxin